jgi:hypothetical protein
MKWLGFLLPLTLSLATAAQTDKPSSTAQKSQSFSGGQASVEGSVVNSLTGKPLSDVHVMLANYDAQHSSPDAVYGAMTSGGGHFSILRIPPARYVILLERMGFLFVPGAANKIVAHGWLQVKAGDQVRGLTLEMVPRAIISGRVLDEYGDPVMNALVTAIPVSEKEDPGFTPIFTTNDRGEFRLSVPPGKFFIQARGWQPGGPQTRIEGTAEAKYVDTYYPGVSDIGAATLVETKPEREINGVDISLARLPVFTIRGTVSGVPQDCGLMVHSDEGKASVTPAQPDDPSDLELGTRKFEIEHLGNGVYQVLARCTGSNAQWQSPPIEVTLTDASVEGIKLELARGVEVSGSIEAADKQAKSLPEQSWSVTLKPIGRERLDLRRTAESALGGAFTIKDVFPDRYRVQLAPLPENGYVQSVSVNESLAADGVIDFSSGVEGSKLKVTLGLDGAQMSGHLNYGDGGAAAWATVFLFPDREDFDSSEVRQASSGADGAYSFKGLAPGRYKLLPMTLVPSYIRDYPGSHVSSLKEVLKNQISKGDAIEIKAGDRIQKDLKLVDGGDASGSRE